MADLQELEQGQGVGEGVDESTAQDTTAQELATRQPVNLDDLPEFRKFRSETDKRIADIERHYQAQLAEAKAQQDRLYQQQLAGMEPEDRLTFERDTALRRAEEAERRAQQYEIDQAKRNALQGIATKAKVPVDVLMDANSPDHAWEIAWDYREQQEAKAAKETEEAKEQRQKKREANKVDLGGGAPPPALDEWSQIEKKVKATGSTRDLFAEALKFKK